MAAPVIPGVEDEASKHTFLEDFAANSNVGVQDADAETLEIAFTVPNTTNGQSTKDFYKKAVDGLKQRYEKLTKLRLRGGYTYKPRDPKSANELKGELDNLIQTLKTIDEVVNGQGVHLRRLILTAILGFDDANGVDVSGTLQAAFPEEPLHKLGNTSWSVPFKIEHGRGVLKLSISNENQFSDRAVGRSRYFPVNTLSRFMGPGPMIGGASYDPVKNVTKIWTAKTGNVELEGNHMDSEELEQYFPRNLNDE